MTVYLIFFSIFVLLACLMELNLTRRSFVIIFMFAYLLMVLFVGLRWETGNDWREYISYYEHATSLHSHAEFADGFEIGYRLLNVVIHHTGLTYAGFLLIYSAIYLGLMFASILNESKELSGWVILQFYAPFIMGLMGTARQAMAMGICMFAIRYLMAKKLFPFLVCIALAFAFHSSAIIFLLAWPIARVDLTLRRLIIVIVCGVALLAVGAGSIISDTVGNFVMAHGSADLANHFMLEQTAQSADFATAIGDRSAWNMVSHSIFLLLIVLLYPLYQSDTDKLYFKYCLFGYMITFVLSGVFVVLADRLSLYFIIFQLHLLAAPIRRFNKPVFRNIYTILLITLCLAKLYSGTALTFPKTFIPYKGVIINSDVKRDLGWFHNDY